ncbi:hypothetical protein [Sphingosinicella microcystinivorans]|uniref:Uncharacterized protein n=1 Tax=Sphingosinicella microcystinivorans TaxID=335406 RepID=A0AAD1D3F0_SPHMI|nr:hypothetical protein [Sphingosinicella microcystinivorans]RKS84380.1 hypothetical protein DFR51_3719 [Sphingosinicella microcystinivorans]BBE33083.1 hypothetical protein SmB9_07410 [Sphingosinicella microcystinivorans]
MDDHKDVLPLRIVAARFININEQVGLAELDRITESASRVIHKRYTILLAAFAVALLATAITLIPGLLLVASETPGADVALIVGLVCFALLMAVLSVWRSFQYGGLKASKPQKAVYADADDPAARNLERLFAVLQLESTPRAFYRFRNDTRRYVDERYFFGSLRAAHVSKSSALRDSLFGPTGFWFARELFLEADIDQLITSAKARPSRTGAPKTYDYTDAVMSLIEHPFVRSLQIGKRGNQKQIVALLEDWYHSRRRPAPSETQLSLYAKQILDVIAKNRATKS